MAELLKSAPKPPTTDDVVEGPVIAIGRACVFVDLHPFGTGIIFGREYLSARETLKNVNVGDTVTAKIIGTDNADGYIELSLREARQALIWGEAEMAVQKKSLFELAITDANKGGLIINWNGIQGFLPASQLAPAHYPRVPDGDKEKIFAELKRMVGQKLDVQIITANPKEQKLIFSEKGAGVSERTSLVEKYHVGDVVGGIVTGATEFGVFIKLEEGLEGLVHISEMDWALVENPKTRYKAGDNVKVYRVGFTFAELLPFYPADSTGAPEGVVAPPSPTAPFGDAATLTPDSTTIIGPPVSGAYAVHAIWVDKLNAVFRCTANGNPGTWIQEKAAIVPDTSFTGTIPVNYLITIPGDNWAQFYWDGAAWQAVNLQP